MQSFEELMELAAKGKSTNVNIHIRDLKGGAKDDFYGLFPDDLLSFCFGKACDKGQGKLMGLYNYWNGFWLMSRQC